MPPEQPTVLLVDDEEDIVDVYALAFSDDYVVEKAYSGEEALEKATDADAILLDRRMPGLSGGDVLDEIRRCGVGARVAMVTAVDPDFDIVEMEFDAYLTKPVTDDELRSTVDELLTLSEYDSQVRERFSVAEKLTTLEAEKPKRELESSSEYQTLRERADELDARASETVGQMDPNTFEKAFFDIDAGDADADET
ncbi:HalX domain-containing protein [Haloplanus salilacus]|uniref:HalX domain-containing protein n=1 Tax=Haloplanus salilacus TaxID=2949994 RepID=UPI0030D0E513